jgi:hypothetical protein
MPGPPKKQEISLLLSRFSQVILLSINLKPNFMSESMQLVKDKSLLALSKMLADKPVPADFGLPPDFKMPQGFIFKGLVICPSFQDTSFHPVVYVNPVFGPADNAIGDIIVQTNLVQSCPYPPGYPPNPQPANSNIVKFSGV